MMKITKTHKKIVCANIKNIEEFESYISNFDKDFNKLPESLIENVQNLLNENSKISHTKVMRFHKKLMGSHKSKFVIDYWINRGYTRESASYKVSEFQSKLSSKRYKKIHEMRKAGDDSWKKQFNTTIEYFENKGYTKNEAKKMLSERQKTFSLNKCIEKYGLDSGIDVWKKRQTKWIETMKNKSEEELMDINLRRTVKFRKASQKSLSIFSPLYEFLINNGICEKKEVFLGIDGSREWFFKNHSSFFSYDFCIPKFKLIFEFQGKKWHPDYRLTENELKEWKTARGNISASVIRERDRLKKEEAERRGFKIIYLWECDDTDKNMEIAFNSLCEIVKTTEFNVPISSISKLMTSSTVEIETPDGYQEVREFYVKENKQLYTLLFEDGRRLKCSDDHYLLLSNGEWTQVRNLVAAKDLTYSTFRFVTDTGNLAIIAIVNEGIGTVNDLTVDHPEHYYYANGIASHNTGKTILAIAVGLHKTINTGGVFERLIVTRPVEPIGRDIGFLPGTFEEKMLPWIQPIYDNISFLTSQKSNNRSPGAKKYDASRKKFRNVNEYDTVTNRNPYIAELQENGRLEIEAITYIRGRSIPRSYVIVDEAQNLSMHALKTLITRAGEGTKIVLTGDVEQIDNSYVDAYTNGLSHAVEKFKHSKLAAHVTLVKGERSALATIASKIL